MNFGHLISSTTSSNILFLTSVLYWKNAKQQSNKVLSVLYKSEADWISYLDAKIRLKENILE